MNSQRSAKKAFSATFAQDFATFAVKFGIRKFKLRKYAQRPSVVVITLRPTTFAQRLFSPEVAQDLDLQRV